jgi:hypothetical protein
VTEVVPCRCPDRVCFAEHHTLLGTLTDDELAEYQRRFEQANAPAAVARHQRREMRRLLSRRARLRIWYRKHLTSAGAWLCAHGCWRAARALWRVTGLWGGQ